MSKGLIGGIAGRFNSIAKEFTKTISGEVSNSHNSKSNYYGSLPHTDYSDSFPYRVTPTMEDCVLARRKDRALDLAVRLYTDFTFGSYNFTASDDSQKSKEIIKLLEKWAKLYNLGAMLEESGLDGFASGNVFFYLKISTNKETGGTIANLELKPLHIFKAIKTTDGLPSGYETSVFTPGDRGRNTNVESTENIRHFAWMKDSSSYGWGRGFAQNFLEHPIPYKSTKGETIYPPNLLQTRSMMKHIRSLTAYYGIPRYLINTKSKGDDHYQAIKKAFNSLDPGQTIISNAETDVKSMELNPKNFFGSGSDGEHNTDAILASMCPLIALFQNSRSFSFASAETAAKAMEPVVKSYQKSFKEFFEGILEEIVDYAFTEGDFKKHGIEINFTPKDVLTLDNIGKIVDILKKDPEFDAYWDPSNIIQLINESGGNLTPVKNSSDDTMRRLASIQKRKMTADMEKVEREEKEADRKIKEAKLSLLERLGARTR